jgi:tellurite resistance protein TerA
MTGPSPARPRVTLTKSAPAVSLSKQGAAGGVLRVNLNWNAHAAGPGAPPVDLDLGCLWELSNGTKGVVQALGNLFTAHASPQHSPVIWLDGDDRSGSSAAGENLLIDLNQAAWLRRVLVFTYIYQGAPNWAAANGLVTLFPASGPQIEMRLDEADPAAGMCAIALLENRDGELVVQREVRYIRGGHPQLDQAYGWGIRWTAGQK